MQDSDVSWVGITEKVGYHSAATLTLLVWDGCIMFEDEVQYIWSGRCRAYIKGLYLGLKYLGIIVQIGNYCITMYISSHLPVRTSMCNVWYTYQTVVSQIMMSIVQIILMIRLYAFYNRSRIIAAALVALLFAQFAITITCVKLSIPQFFYTPSCLVKNVPHTVMYLGLGNLICQSIMFVLTVGKHIAGLKTGWGRTPIVSLMIRDGAGFYVAITALLIVTTLYMKEEKTMGVVAYYWLVSILALAGCRIILNMQQLSIPREPSSVELTTGLFNSIDLG